MYLTRLSTIALLVVLLSSYAFAQFEKEAGKIVSHNAMMPAPAGSDKLAFLRMDEKVPGAPLELYLLELATGKETRLLPGVNFNEQPTYAFAFSPSGNEFVVPVKGTKGAWDLFKYTVGSRTGTQIGDLSPYVDVPSPEVIRSLNLDKSSLLQITDLSWSPSGKRLIFSMMRLDRSAIWWIDLATGRARQATEDKTGYWGAFHPDDERFCYTDNIIQEGISTSEGIVLRSIASGDVDTLLNTKDNEFAGTISSDGKFLAYNRNVNNTNNVWVYNLATRESRALTNSTGGKHCAYPKWSPDGKKIYFQGNGFEKQTVVFVRDFIPF